MNVPPAAWQESRRIAKAAARLIAEYRCRDPREIALGLGIRIKYLPLTGTPGVYAPIKPGLALIMLADNLDWGWERLVLAHELGHHVIHGERVRCTGREFFASSRFEVEANSFAAELLISTREIKGMYFARYSLRDMAMDLEVPPEIVNFKLLQLASYDPDIVIKNTEPAPFFLRDINK